MYISNNHILIIASILCAFISIEVVHQLTATPMTIANAIFLIGWFFINKAKKSKALWLIGGLIIVISLHIHPGVFVLFGLLSFSALVFWYLNFDSKVYDWNIFIFSIFIVLALILIEALVFYVFSGERYLGLISSENLAIERHNMSLLQLISYNALETRDRLIDFVNLYSFKGVGLFIYIFSLFITYSLNKKIFVINLVFLASNFIGLIHYIPYHKGELIEYIGQSQLIFIAATFSYGYFKIIGLVRRGDIRNVFSIILLSISLYFLYDKYLATSNQIEIRSSRHNFPNEISIIVDFMESLPKKTSIIVGDEFTLVMVLSAVSDKYLLLSDDMRRGSKEWSAPRDMLLPSAYIGTPKKVVSFAGKEYKLVNHETTGRVILSKIEIKDE